MRYRCTCFEVEDAESPGCWGVFDLPEGQEPETFIGDYICPACMEKCRDLLERLKAKGVTVVATFNESEAT